MANYVTEIGLLIIGVFLLSRGLPGVLQLVGGLGWQRVPGIMLGSGMGLGGIASAQASHYEPGQQVDGWVDPRNPMNSVLRRSAPSSLVMTALGVAVLIAATVSMV